MTVLYTFKSAFAPNHLLTATTTYQIVYLLILCVTGLVWPLVGVVGLSCILSYCAHRFLNKRLAVPAKSALVITGCSTGIGHDGAIHLAKLGWVVFAGVRKEEDAQKLINKARSEKSSSGKDIRIVPLILDVTNQQQINQSVQRVTELCAKEGLTLHGLINNAGYGEMAVLEILPIEKIKKQYDVNVFGQVAVTQAFLPLLRAAAQTFNSRPAYALSSLTSPRSHSPRIVFVTSVVGKFTAPGVGAYCSSKFALESLSDAFRRELYKFGIDVVIIEPGAIVSGFHATALSASASTTREAEGKQGSFDAYKNDIEHLSKANMTPPLFSTTAVTDDAFTASLLDSRPHARYQAGADAIAGMWLFPKPEYQGKTNVVELTPLDFQNKVELDSSDTMWVVQFFTGWADDCAQFSPLFAELSLQFKVTGLEFAKLDVGRWPKLAEKYSVDVSVMTKQLPTLILFRKGKPVEGLRLPPLELPTKMTLTKATVMEHFKLQERFNALEKVNPKPISKKAKTTGNPNSKPS